MQGKEAGAKGRALISGVSNLQRERACSDISLHTRRFHVEKYSQAQRSLLNLGHCQVIMAHLFGAGDREPLRHRLLPEDEYNNYGTCSAHKLLTLGSSASDEVKSVKNPQFTLVEAHKVAKDQDCT